MKSIVLRAVALFIALIVLSSIKPTYHSSASSLAAKMVVTFYSPIETAIQKKEQITFYNAGIPMPVEHQKYLELKVKEYQLDYEKTLAVIKHESVFDYQVVSPTNDYGYFQINEINHSYLASKLETPNEPLNPYINIEWGTYTLSQLYDYWQDKGYTGEKLDEAVWSSYNKGLNGYRNTGPATNYVNKVKAALKSIQQENKWTIVKHVKNTF